jgi:hypothetical protein
MTAKNLGKLFASSPSRSFKKYLTYTKLYATINQANTKYEEYGGRYYAYGITVQSV